MRRIVSRIFVEAGVRQVDMTGALGVTRTPIRRQYTNHDEEMPIDLSDVLLLARCPATAEFARRLLLELLAELDTHQHRVVDLERLAQSPIPEQREKGIRVLKTLAEKYGLEPTFVINTADIT